MNNLISRFILLFKQNMISNIVVLLSLAYIILVSIGVFLFMLFNGLIDLENMRTVYMGLHIADAYYGTPEYQRYSDTIEYVRIIKPVIFTIKFILGPFVILIFFKTLFNIFRKYKNIKLMSFYEKKIYIRDIGIDLLKSYESTYDVLLSIENIINISSIKKDLKLNILELKNEISKIILLSTFDKEYSIKANKIKKYFDQQVVYYNKFKVEVDLLLNSNTSELKAFQEFKIMINALSDKVKEIENKYKSIFSFEELIDYIKKKDEIIARINDYDDFFITINKNALQDAIKHSINELKDMNTILDNILSLEELIKQLSEYAVLNNSYLVLNTEVKKFKYEYEKYLPKDLNKDLNQFSQKLENNLNMMYKISREDIKVYEEIYNEINNTFKKLINTSQDKLKIINFNKLATLDDKKIWILENGYLSFLFKNDEVKSMMEFMDEINIIKIFTDTDAKKLNIFSFEYNDKLKWSQFFLLLQGEETKEEVISLIRSINDKKQFKSVKNFVLSQKSDLKEEEREVVRKFTTLL